MANDVQVVIRKEQKVVDGKIDTRFYLKLPEYKQEVIIKSQYVSEILNHLQTLNKND
jgi:hypothetical protein